MAIKLRVDGCKMTTLWSGGRSLLSCQNTFLLSAFLVFVWNIKIKVILLKTLYTLCVMSDLLRHRVVSRKSPWLKLQRGFYASVGKSICHYITLLAHYFDRVNDSDDDTTIHSFASVLHGKKLSVRLAVGLRHRFLTIKYMEVRIYKY